LELWNRFGRILPKLHAGENLTLHIEASVDIRTTDAETIRRELEQALADLGIAGTMRVRVNGQQE
jgi:hypothetical protein